MSDDREKLIAKLIRETSLKGEQIRRTLNALSVVANGDLDTKHEFPLPGVGILVRKPDRPDLPAQDRAGVRIDKSGYIRIPGDESAVIRGIISGTGLPPTPAILPTDLPPASGLPPGLAEPIGVVKIPRGIGIGKLPKISRS